MSLVTLDRKRLVRSEVDANLTALASQANTTKFPQNVVEPFALGYRNLSQAPGIDLSATFGRVNDGSFCTFTASGAWYIVDQSKLKHAATSGTDGGYPTVLVGARVYYGADGSGLATCTKCALAVSPDNGATWTILTTNPTTVRYFGRECGGLAPVYTAVLQQDFMIGGVSYVPHNIPQDRPVTLVAAFSIGDAQGTPVGNNVYALAVDHNTANNLLAGEIWLSARDLGV